MSANRLTLGGIITLFSFTHFIFFAHNIPLHALPPFPEEDFPTLCFAARVSGAAYAQSSQANTTLVSGEHYNTMEETLRRETGVALEKVTKTGSDGTGAHAVIATKGSEVYVAFPGCTDGFLGAINLLKRNTTYNERKCHGGMLPYYLPLKDDLLNRLKIFREEGKEKFVFTGHCSGGSKVCPLMRDFLNSIEKFSNISVQLITFAYAPSVFPPAETAEINKNPRFKSYNIWLSNDFWRYPSTWLDWLRGNVPLSERIVIETSSEVPYLDRHRLSTYYQKLRASNHEMPSPYN